VGTESVGLRTCCDSLLFPLQRSSHALGVFLLCFYCFVLVLISLSLFLSLCARRASPLDILSCSSLFVKFSCFKSLLFYCHSFVWHRHPCLYLPETTDASSSASLLFVYQKQVRDRLWRSGRDNRVVLRFLEFARVWPRFVATSFLGRFVGCFVVVIGSRFSTSGENKNFVPFFQG
jgi:hypothetical protein